MIRLFSRIYARLILPFCLWLMVSSSSTCQAFQSSRSWGSLMEMTELHEFSSVNITNLHIDETLNGTYFNQTDDVPPDSLSTRSHNNLVDGGAKTSDLSMILLWFSDITYSCHPFPKQLYKSWSAFVHGSCYLYRNLIPIVLWDIGMALFSYILIKLFLVWLERSSTFMHDGVIRVCGNFMFHCSKVVLAVLATLGRPIRWLLLHIFHPQLNEMYLDITYVPIREEIVCRLMLHHIWKWIQYLARVLHSMHSGGKSKDQSKKYCSKFMSLLEHEYSFRVLSSLLFGIAHIGNHYHLWKSNEINLQKKFVLTGMAHAVSTFCSSFFYLTPLFETRGVMAAIGAHAAWNLFVAMDDDIFWSLLLVSLFWGAKIILDNVGNDMSTVFHKLTPPHPSRDCTK